MSDGATKGHDPNDLDPAFSHLLAYDKRLVSLAIRILGDRDEALDAVQESYMQAYKAFHTFRGDSQPYTWLCRITLNECARRGRRKTTRRSREVDLEVLRERGLEPVGDAPGHAAVERGGTASVVRSAVEKLGSPYKEAVILRYFEGMSYEEIANVCGCSLGTVKSRLARAHGKLESKLGVDLLRDI